MKKKTGKWFERNAWWIIAISMLLLVGTPMAFMLAR